MPGKPICCLKDIAATVKPLITSVSRNEVYSKLFSSYSSLTEIVMSKKVFISHATVDRHLIDILIKLLSEFGITEDDIFCTSVSGTLECGKNFIEQIKNNVKDSKIVLFILSEHFFLSNFCLAELGAAWALNQNILPVIIPPISTTEYNSTPLLGIQALDVLQRNFVENFLNDLVRKQVIENTNIENDKPKVIKEFNTAIKKELGLLRKDSRGFYVGRLVEKGIYRNYKYMGILYDNVICWKLNGLLDIETDPNITEHWIYGKNIGLTGKVQFKIKNDFKESSKSRVFITETFHEFPNL